MDRDTIQIVIDPHRPPVDLLLQAAGLTWLIECKSSAASGPIAGAIDRLRNTGDPSTIPLIAVPYMGEAGRELCQKAQVSWLDLSGNAKITAPGVRIWIEGRPNRFVRRGRPANLFAPKSSRVARQLLLDSETFQSQSTLADETGLDDGYVSKIVSRLRDDNLVETDEQGHIRARDPSLLLDAWQSAYRFDRHRIIKGHVAARSGDALLPRLAGELAAHELEHAATGLAAAWLYSQFASFRIVTFYLTATPPKAFLKHIQFSDEERGANTWFVIPRDDGVFHGGQTLDGIPCVSAVQVFLDLKGHPERSAEAADELRSKYLNWRSHDQQADDR